VCTFTYRQACAIHITDEEVKEAAKFYDTSEENIKRIVTFLEVAGPEWGREANLKRFEELRAAAPSEEELEKLRAKRRENRS
jgi:hypothetical protein